MKLPYTLPRNRGSEKKNAKTKQQADLILEADDEKEILSILANDEFTSNKDFKSKFNL